MGRNIPSIDAWWVLRCQTVERRRRRRGRWTIQIQPYII